MARLLLHHGIWTHGDQSTIPLARDLESIGYRTYNPQHSEFARVLGAGKMARRFSRDLIANHKPGDHALGHSHGCLVILEAMRAGARFGTVFLVGAAVEEDVTFPYHGAERIINVYNPFDIALAAGTAIPDHPFGALGLTGYAGPPDARVEEHAWPSRDGRWNHTMPYFSKKNRPKLVGLILDTIPAMELPEAV